jgi:hypothetical protein
MAPEPSSCNLCMHTQAGSVVTETLLFHTYYSCAGFAIGSCTHKHTTYLVCSHGNQYICFNPTYCPWVQLEIQSIHNPGNPISCTLVFNPDKPISVFFDACAVIDQGACGGIGCGCGSLARERAYTSNNSNSWPYDDVVCYCLYWGCVSQATWQRAKYAAPLHKVIAAPDCTPGTCRSKFHCT